MKTIPLLLLALLVGGCASHVPPEIALSSVQVNDLRDIDADGVINARDLCSASPDNSALSNGGCSEWTSAPSRKIHVVNFDLNSAKIRDDQRDTLARVVKEVMDHADATIVLIGDTSPEGSDELNQKLGKQRADAIEAVLLSSGMPAKRIEGFVYNQEQVRARLDRRERRTIILVKRPNAAKAVGTWHIYQAEEQQQLAEIKGAKQ
jgi:OOP family OmpA-OmpF porin